MYIHGCSLVDEDMNMFYILQTIEKMKASLSVLIKDDRNLIQDTKSLYINKQTLWTTFDQKHKDNHLSKSSMYKRFYKFMEQDEYEVLKEHGESTREDIEV